MTMMFNCIVFVVHARMFCFIFILCEMKLVLLYTYVDIVTQMHLFI